jgi:hypothetical protein
MHSRFEIARGAPPAGLLAQRVLAGGTGAVIPFSPPRRPVPAPALAPPDMDAALLDPAAVFRSPDEVVRHPLLSLDAKREILRRWACDEQLIEIAQWEGMPEGPPSRLAEVRSALLRLADEWHPHPAAPAAFAFRYEVDERLALAA